MEVKYLMQMQYQIKQTDGKWDSTGPIQWTDYNGSQSDLSSIPNGTLMKANIPNINRDNVPYYPFKQTGWDAQVLAYDDASNNWKAVDFNKTNVIETIKGLKTVTILTSDNTPKLYVCRNNADYSLIPNLATTVRVETYISDDITKDSFNQYRQWNHYGSVSSEPFIPISIFVIDKTTMDNHMQIFGVKLVSQSDGSKVLAYHFSYTLPGYQSDPATDDGLLPTIQSYYYAAADSPTPVDGLEVRVTQLENIVADLQARVIKLEQQITNIPELIAWTNEAVSKHYVAR